MSEQRHERNQNNFLVHGGILALASVLVRIIGMIYRVPMVRIIGREGSGYYSTAFSIYNILLLLSSYSLPLAVSKMVSARVALKKWKETERVLLVAMLFAVGVGLVFALLTYFGADFFCTKVMRMPLAAVALKWMAPTIFIMAVLGVLRGFFQGLQTMIPTAISQVIEQIANAFISVGMAFALDMPLVLLLVGLIYIIETLSDIIQVCYFKLTHGKRIFKMAPIHHHFEMCGWSEVKIWTVFVLVTVIMCVIAYFGVRIWF